MDEKRIAQLMKSLECSRDEAIEIIQEDEKIDKMSMKEVTADLSADEKQAIKDATKSDRKVTTYQFQKRERKADDTKRMLVQALVSAVDPIGESVEVLNIEREFTFVCDGRKFKVTLSAPRS